MQLHDHTNGKRLCIAQRCLFDEKSSSTGKYFSEALILASTNPQYDKRLSIELSGQYIKIPSSEHVENMYTDRNSVKAKYC